MARVTARHNESFQSLLRRFKNACDEDKIVIEARERQFFEKPSVVKKKNRIKAQRRLQQKLQKEQDERTRNY